MGKNKKYRKHLEGQRQALVEHMEKIEEEKQKSEPRQDLIEVWEKALQNIRVRIAKLERRLKE